MATSAPEPMLEIVTEAIVVIDLVESTLTSNLFGWYAVGRQSLRDLRALIGEVGKVRGLRCVRSTGDGYLLTFYDPQSAEMAAIRAVEAVFELLGLISVRNREVSEERALNLRCAVHLGEVDVVPNDREGPHISMAFRLEEISRASLPAALNPIPPEQFPLQNYVLCSEEVAGILSRRATHWELASIGLLKLKGFPGWREVFRITSESTRPMSAVTCVFYSPDADPSDEKLRRKSSGNSARVNSMRPSSRGAGPFGKGLLRKAMAPRSAIQVRT